MTKKNGLTAKYIDGNFGNVKSFLSFVAQLIKRGSDYGSTRKNKAKSG
ncbi:MAG TPA: hypothetical protein VIU35_08085 [Chitinophagaceae bacterium]